MEIVHADLITFLKKNIFPSRTVLVFPPFNGFRRFLIHKLIEDNFTSSQVVAFSIGQDVDRRICVCYKGLLREDQAKSVPQSSRLSLGMIEKEQLPRQRSTPTAAVYRPPAARLAETRRSGEEGKTSDTKRVRRPDQQVYVPRPKRVSYGNDLPRSRSHSSSRTSLDSDSSNDKSNHSVIKTEDGRLSEGRTEIHEENDYSNHLLSQPKVQKEEASCSKEPVNSHTLECTDSSTLKMIMDAKAEIPAEWHEAEGKPALVSHSVIDSAESSIISVGNEVPFTTTNVMSEASAIQETENLDTGCKKCLESQSNAGMHVNCQKTNPILIERKGSREAVEPNASGTGFPRNRSIEDSHEAVEPNVSGTGFPRKRSIEDSHEAVEPNVCGNGFLRKRSIDEAETISIPTEQNIPKEEAMETISISSDSRDDHSSNITTSLDSRDSESSSVPEPTKKSEKMEIEHCSKLSANKKNDCESETCEPREKNKKNRRIFPNEPVSDVLIISDTSSSSESFKMASDVESKKKTTKEKVKKQIRSKDLEAEKSARKDKVDPGESDWESLYDDSGECLVPNLMEELTNSVGRVRVTSADSDYREFQTIEERTSDGECIIEIYDFPAEFKTTDLINIFAPYRSRNFQIKWVDDTHALGVFPSPLMADEVLSCTLPFVKTRPLRQGTAESRVKARNLVLPALPPMERPKTCTALARRLVSGALGLRLPTSSQDREKERQMLKEAREKRRLEAKQREAAWDGTISSENCI